MKKQITLDIETTGMNILDNHYIGHKIIEIGAIEIKNRKITNNIFHFYINPQRKIDEKAYKIHGIKNIFLYDKPTFAHIAKKFITFIKNAELIIHNASFDIGFINYELKLMNNKLTKIQNICTITDTLSIARKLFPGKKNDLNSLCLRYKINNAFRIKHGALIDAKLLAIIYLNMTQKQIQIKLNPRKLVIKTKNNNKNNFLHNNIIFANDKENTKHIKYLKYIKKKYKKCIWLN